MKANKKYSGKIQVRTAQTYRTPYTLRRPTGILSLDIGLGGGWPAGGSSQIFGGRSSGKTHVVFKTAGQVQRNYGANSIILVGISEMRMDVGFARMSGFCMAYLPEQIATFNRIRVDAGYPEFTKEEIADLSKQIGVVQVISGNTGGDMLEGTLEALDHFGSHCQLVIVDSLGSLLTNDQDEKSVSDKHYGGSSGILTLWQTKMQPKFINDRDDGSLLETTVIGINQVRAMIGGPTPNATRPAAGAKAWDHAQLTSVELKQGEPIYADSKCQIQSGRTIKWNIKKGKAGTHDGKKGEYNWHFYKKHDPVFWSDVEQFGNTYGVDTITDVVETAKDLGVLQQAGSWVKCVIGDQEIFRVQGIESAAEKVVNDPELEQILRNACLDTENLTIRYT